MEIVSIDLAKVVPEMIQLCVDIHGQGISHPDGIRIVELLEDSVIQGTWKHYSTTMMECSVCKKHVPYHRYKYCPHCGARMKGD
jgi:hypothetical protein